MGEVAHWFVLLASPERKLKCPGGGAAPQKVAGMLVAGPVRTLEVGHFSPLFTGFKEVYFRTEACGPRSSMVGDPSNVVAGGEVEPMVGDAGAPHAGHTCWLQET